MPEFRELVGRRIREERERVGHTNQRQFAEMLGIDPSQLCRIELGQRNVDSVLLRRIADALEIPMDEFFEERRQQLALARQGDADDESTQDMIAWTLGLRRDIDLLFDYVGGRGR
jgi:transcriptional regulator with XRE-family HTH domain